jgi:hypothetical protein
MGKDISPDFGCPCCGSKDGGYIIHDYSDMHSKEVMLECFDCDSVYIYHYEYIRTEILRNRYKLEDKKCCYNCIYFDCNKHQGYFCTNKYHEGEISMGDKGKDIVCGMFDNGKAKQEV